MRYIVSVVVIFSCLFSCGNDPISKPNGYLRLEYPEPIYTEESIEGIPFSFDRNLLAKKITTQQLRADTKSYGITLEYPELKGTIYLTYKDVENSQEHLTNFLRDAQNFTQKHTIKADEITEQVYSNKEHKVYGMFYEVGGNAASQSQFYVTDSINHFLTGSLYFYAKPNYDSILPAAYYLKNDIKNIMETVRWK